MIKPRKIRKSLSSVALTKELDAYYHAVAVHSISDSIKEELYKMANELTDEIMSQLEVREIFREEVGLAGKKGFLVSVIVTPKDEK